MSRLTLYSSLLKFGVQPSTIYHKRILCPRPISTSTTLFLDPIAKPHHSSKNRNVEIGTEYENSVVKSLRGISIGSRTCGGPGDNGVDFRGTWSLPDNSTNFHVVGQCKAKKNKVQSGSVRDLESVVLNERSGTIGILVTTCGYSNPAISRFYSSPMPLILVTMPQVDLATNPNLLPKMFYLPITEFIWNRNASALLKNKLTVTKTFNLNTANTTNNDAFDTPHEQYEVENNLTFLFEGLPLASLD